MIVSRGRHPLYDLLLGLALHQVQHLFFEPPLTRSQLRQTTLENSLLILLILPALLQDLVGVEICLSRCLSFRPCNHLVSASWELFNALFIHIVAESP